MSKRFVKFIFIAISLSFISAKSFATLINFETFGGTCSSLGPTITTEGFTFTDNAGTGGLYGCNAGVIHTGSSVALISANSISNFTMVEENNALFTLNSLDAGARTGNSATSFTVFGTKFDTSLVFQTFDFAALSFDTFTLSAAFTDLVSVDFVSADGNPRSEFLVDNINLNQPVAASAPASIGFVGLSMLILARLRKRKS